LAKGGLTFPTKAPKQDHEIKIRRKDMIKKIETNLLEIGYKEYGHPNDTPVILLHGFPYDINAYNESSDILNQKGF
jgi:hypothetical protein